MNSEMITLDVDSATAVATVTIERPEKLNAITMAMRREIVSVFNTIGADDSVRVVIVRGSGDRAFSAGGDIPEFRQYPPHQLTELAFTVGAPERIRQPVIAAIDGMCFGGGLEFALACDFRIATDRSQFGFPEITLGALPGSGGTQRSVRLLGLTRAKMLVLTGQPIDAAQAEHWGLVSRTVAPDDFNTAVETLVAQLLRLSPVALKFAKAVLNKALDGSFANGIEMEGKSMAILCGMDDFGEGVEAWKERRPPVFHGR